jgi:hypothetical protein
MSNTLQRPPIEDVVSGPDGGVDGGQRRTVLAVVLVAGLLVLGAATYFLFLSGGSSDENLGVVTSGAPKAAPVDGKKSNQANNNDKVPQQVDANVQVGRDPFAPLAAEAPVVTEPDPNSVPGTGTGTTGTTGDGSTNPTTPVDTTTNETVYSLTVKSVNANKGTADIDINGKVYTVSTGDVFPSETTGPFKLVKVSRSDSGQGQARVIFGSDLPVVLKQGKTADFVIR